MRRFPTASEIERMAEELTVSPRLPSDLAKATRMPFRRATAALKALRYQGRAVRFQGQGWAVRRERA